MVILLAIMEKKIFSSTFSSVMLLNWPKVLEFCSLGMRTVTALCHSAGMKFFFYATLRRFHQNLRTPGQFL